MLNSGQDSMLSFKDHIRQYHNDEPKRIALTKACNYVNRDKSSLLIPMMQNWLDQVHPGYQVYQGHTRIHVTYAWTSLDDFILYFRGLAETNSVDGEKYRPSFQEIYKNLHPMKQLLVSEMILGSLKSKLARFGQFSPISGPKIFNPGIRLVSV